MRPCSSESSEYAQGLPGSVSSRRRFAAAGAATALAMLGARPLVGRLVRLDDATAAPSKAEDARILQLVLQLEYTQVAFYEQALQHGLSGALRDFAGTALDHERAHLAAIRQALGAAAGARPSFRFGAKVESADTFVRTSIELEDVAVAAYNGQAANLTKETLAAAAEIVSVEARHAAWIRAIAGEVAAPDPVDKPITAEQAARRLHEIGMRT
jgi:rubrerythrin